MLLSGELGLMAEGQRSSSVLQSEAGLGARTFRKGTHENLATCQVEVVVRSGMFGES